uniref:Uncharacterized protein n=1 Tax=Lepeophtheirus salmonis TaxID=72036 RepID=A0A0K2TNB9_LEPSM
MGFVATFFIILLVLLIVMGLYISVRFGLNYSRGMRGYEAVPHIESFRNIFSSFSRRGAYQEI